MDFTIWFFIGIFLLSVITVFVWGMIARKKGIVGTNYCKKEKQLVNEAGGMGLWIPLVVGTIIAFILTNNWFFFAWLALVLVFSIIGFLDDTRHKFLKTAVRWKTRALPIAVISLIFAFFFAPNWIWIIPIALFIAGLASLNNTFAGLNGWEVGNGFIVSIAVSFVLIGSQFFWLAIILSASILGLLIWNRYPAYILPGDSATLLIGSAIAGILVLTQNIWLMLLGLLLYLPALFDFFVLKMLSNPKDASQQKIPPYKPMDNGYIGIPDYPDGRIKFDFAKLILRIFNRPLKEWQIVAVIWIVVILNSFIWLFVFGKIF